MHEKLIKRTIWTAKCEKCGLNDIRTEKPPRERMCGCNKWVKFEEQSYIGKEFK